MEVEIGPIKYKVEFVENPSYNELDLFGFICNETNTIQIKQSLEESRKKIIILHEVFHGILMQCGLNTIDEEDAKYEQIIECLSHGMFSLIKDNPNLLEYLNKKD